MIANARARQHIKVWGYCKDDFTQARRRHFREKRRQETRAWAVQVFRAFALVLAAVAGFCSATFGQR